MTARVWILLCVIIVLGLGLRTYTLSDRSLWTDEIATIASANGNSLDPSAYTLRGQRFEPVTPQPAQFFKRKAVSRNANYQLSDTAAVLKQNIHPPGFFSLMALWLSIFPPTPFWLRILPLIFGLGCIPMMFLIGKRLEGHRLGLTSAAMFAFSAYQVSHAQDARQYTLITLLALVSVWLVLSPRKRMWVWIALLTAAGVYCQYLYALFAVFIYGYALTRYPWRVVVLSAAGAILLFLPWLPALHEQSVFLKTAGHYTEGLWNPVQLPETLWRTLNDFLFPKVSSARLITLLLMLFAGIGYAWDVLKQKNPIALLKPESLKQFRWDHPVSFALLWLGVILTGQCLLDLLQDSHTVSIRRYTLLAAPAFTLLFSWVLLHLKVHTRLREALLYLVIVLTAASTIDLLHRNKFVSDDFKSTASYINQHRNPDDLVLMHKSGAILVGLAYYLNPDQSLQGLSNTLTLETLKIQTQKHPRVWLALCHSSPSIQVTVENLLQKQGYQADMPSQKFPGLRLYRYALKD